MARNHEFEVDVTSPTTYNYENETLKLRPDLKNPEQTVLMWILDGGPYIRTKNSITVERYETLKENVEGSEKYHLVEVPLQEFVQLLIDGMDVDMEVEASDGKW